MRNLYLRVGPNKKIIDTLEIDKVELNFSIKDFKTYGKRNSSFSKPITVLRTKNSDEIFKGLHNINSVDGYDIGNKVAAEVVEDGIVILSGSLQVIDITEDFYKVIVATDNLSIFDTLGDKLIKGNVYSDDDLEFTGELYTHILDASHARYYMNSSDNDYNIGRGIAYPIIDFTDTIEDAHSIKHNYPILPAVAAKQIFEKIIADLGYTLEFSDDVSTIMNHCYIPCNNNNLRETYKYAKWFPDACIGELEIEGTYVWQYTDGQGPDPDHEYIPRYAVPEWSQRSQFVNTVEPVGYDYLIKCPSNFKPQGLPLPIGSLTIDASLIFYKGFHTGGSPDPYAMEATVYLNIYDEIDKSVNTIELGTINTTSVDPVTRLLYLNKTVNFVNYESSKLWLTAVPETTPYTVWPSTYNGMNIYYPFLAFMTDSNITITLNNSYYNGNEININDILPLKYKKKDFIDDFLKLFNAYITVKDDYMLIESYNRFFDNEVIDWSLKVDTPSMIISSLKNQFSKTIEIGYTEDKDKYNEDFASKSSVIYGNKLINNDSEFASSSSKILLSTSPTIIKKVYSFASFPSEPSPYISLDESDEIVFQGIYTERSWFIFHRWIYSTVLYSGSDIININSNIRWRAWMDNAALYLQTGQIIPLKTYDIPFYTSPAGGYGDAIITAYSIIKNPTQIFSMPQFDYMAATITFTGIDNPATSASIDIKYII